VGHRVIIHGVKVFNFILWTRLGSSKKKKEFMEEEQELKTK
jgi:hypothetical protein